VFDLFSELMVCASAESGDVMVSQLRMGHELQARNLSVTDMNEVLMLLKQRAV